MKPRRCVIYSRISVAQEASVSIARQIEAAEQYAQSRGWTVVALYRDEGVSATRNKPEDRAGWRALLAAQEPYDVVIVWKIDRLARRITDFWDAYKALDANDQSLVSVMDNLDMTTPVGRVVAGVIAGFAEMEAEAIRERVAGARRYLIANGRVVGGKVPYGWRSVSNPDGPGLVLAKDPDTISVVEQMVARVQRGDTIYSVQKWLNDEGIRSPTGRDQWAYSTVERVLRHPVLAGMTPFNPGYTATSNERGGEVLRDENGLPVVDESIALLSVVDWRAMVHALDDRDSVQSRPRHMRSQTSPLLSGLVVCAYCLDDGGEPIRMHRGTSSGRPAFHCPSCGQTVSHLQPYVVEQLLALKGDHDRFSPIEEVHEGGAALLPEIEHRLDELDGLIRTAPDRAIRTRLQTEQANLLDLRDEKRAEAPVVKYRLTRTDESFTEAWANARDDVLEQRAVLENALEFVAVARGRRGGHGLDTSRIVFGWHYPQPQLVSDPQEHYGVTAD